MLVCGHMCRSSTRDGIITIYAASVRKAGAVTDEHGDVAHVDLRSVSSKLAWTIRVKAEHTQA
eukprot:11839748-Alexandrium_andersonii.AAC.1